MNNFAVSMVVLSAVTVVLSGCAGSDGGRDLLPDSASFDDAADVQDIPEAMDSIDPGTDLEAADAVDAADANVDATDAGDVAPGDLGPQVPDVAAATRAFKLYYRERVERAIVAYNRFMLFGGTTFGTNIGKAGVSLQGDQWEVVPGPNDNNRIGGSLRTTWYAYQIFRSRPLALSLIRMFEGLSFLEAVSGHPGVTARMVYPGWTMDIDGVAGNVQLTRGGSPVQPPQAPDASLESEILSAFFNGVKIRYREEPDDILLNYMPAQEVGPYSTTYSFHMLPAYLRVSDCCTSLMRTPEPYAWAGAFWGNHNSRDNFPDLGMGFVAAMVAKDDQLADADVRASASRAWEAGKRIGDLVQANGSKLMTVDEHNPYDTLVVAGAVRPDGETENEDLGSLADCQMVYLGRALSSQGLALPLPVLPSPGTVESLLYGLMGDDSGCVVANPIQQCSGLGDAFCGKTWSTLEQLEINGTGWLDVARNVEEQSPGSSDLILGNFADVLGQSTDGAITLVDYARGVAEPGLLAQTLKALGEATTLLRTFADILYTKTNPNRLAEKRYDATLLDAQAGLVVGRTSDLLDFAPAEAQIARLEAMLEMAPTQAAAVRTDQQILEAAENEWNGRSDTVKKRYRDAFGQTPPVRPAGDGYEARVFHEGAVGPWNPVPAPRHFVLGGIQLLEALPLCLTNTGILDCTWARLGCQRPDLDSNGKVDAADRAMFDAASSASVGVACNVADDWCQKADLDHSGAVDNLDAAFMAAAEGCHYTLPGPG